MPAPENTKQPSPKKTGLFLQVKDGNLLELFEYPFPDSRPKFNIFVDGSRTQAARTQGKGSKGDLRDYTYIKLRGKSMYVAQWIEFDAQATTVGASSLLDVQRNANAARLRPEERVPLRFEAFIDREVAYRSWLVDHQDGFVLNAHRKPRPSYMRLHTARCATITRYREGEREDAFTGGDYIKVCADDASSLLLWMAEFGASDFSSLCHACKPDAASLDQLELEKARLQADALSLIAAPERLRQALANISTEPPGHYYARTKVFKRNAAVVAAVLRRASGKCEACQEDAPFLRAASKEPYLEVHHKVRLTDGGIDHPDNALALCPNCHRKAHFG